MANIWSRKIQICQRAESDLLTAIHSADQIYVESIEWGWSINSALIMNSILVWLGGWRPCYQCVVGNGETVLKREHISPIYDVGWKLGKWWPRASLCVWPRTNTRKSSRDQRNDTPIIIWLRFAIKLRTNVFASCVNNCWSWPCRVQGFLTQAPEQTSWLSSSPCRGWMVPGMVYVCLQ